MISHMVYVPGQPVAKARPRVTMRGGKPRAYTPKKTADFEELIRSSWGTLPAMDGPIKLIIKLELQIPQSWSKKKKAQALAGEIRPLARPDIDNYAKSVMDSLNGLGYADDSQVVELVVSKEYAEEPGTLITVQSSMPLNT